MRLCDSNNTYGENINRLHTHTPTGNNTPDTNTHTHDKNNAFDPQTNTSHKHLTTLEDGATTVRTTPVPTVKNSEELKKLSPTSMLYDETAPLCNKSGPEVRANFSTRFRVRVRGVTLSLYISLSLSISICIYIYIYRVILKLGAAPR